MVTGYCCIIQHVIQFPSSSLCTTNHCLSFLLLYLFWFRWNGSRIIVWVIDLLLLAKIEYFSPLEIIWFVICMGMYDTFSWREVRLDSPYNLLYVRDNGLYYETVESGENWILRSWRSLSILLEVGSSMCFFGSVCVTPAIQPLFNIHLINIQRFDGREQLNKS